MACLRHRLICLGSILLLFLAFASAASATSIQVTYEFLYATTNPTGSPTTLSRNQIRGTLLGLGNADRAIGTPRTGRLYGLGPLDAFSSSIVLEFTTCGGLICDGPVSLVNLLLNEQFAVSVAQTDVFISTPGGGAAVGNLVGGTVSWTTPESNWTTTGGVNCTGGGLCAEGRRRRPGSRRASSPTAHRTRWSPRSSRPGSSAG